MVNVTERAGERLKTMRDQVIDQPDRCLRLGPTDGGQLGIFPDTVKDSDQVIEHGGVTVLAMDREVAEALADRTIDVDESEGAPRLTLRPR
jgi:Fe-S cluster assembly iron-binding protein IscA